MTKVKFKRNRKNRLKVAKSLCIWALLLSIKTARKKKSQPNSRQQVVDPCSLVRLRSVVVLPPNRLVQIFNMISVLNTKLPLDLKTLKRAHRTRRLKEVKLRSEKIRGRFIKTRVGLETMLHLKIKILTRVSRLFVIQTKREDSSE